MKNEPESVIQQPLSYTLRYTNTEIDCLKKRIQFLSPC